MTIREAGIYCTDQLKAIYDEGEARAISDWLIEHITGTKKNERISNAHKDLQAGHATTLRAYLQRLLAHEPIQYVLHEAWFCGFKLYVDQHVLIPRPETEELVEWIIANCRFPIQELSILDIGTGSGCIPVSLKRRLGKATVWSIDNSEAALQVARRNAHSLGVTIEFRQMDFLDRAQWPALPVVDVIVSNPPYVPQHDRATMQPNVLRYEPATALFVPDNNALVFYEAIADFGKTHLAANGAIYMEIHESMGKACTDLFQSKGYATEIKKDMQGKERMMKGTMCGV